MTRLSVKLADTGRICPRGGPLTFSFALDSQRRLPRDPKLALETAIHQYHEMSYPGGYVLEAVDQFLHIVPRSRRNAEGVAEGFESRLEAILPDESQDRRLAQVFTHVISLLTSSSAIDVKVAITPFGRGIEPDITQKLAGRSVRAELRALVQDKEEFRERVGAARMARRWTMSYSHGWKAYFLSVQ